MILLLDNYDSFTHNLEQYLGEIGCDVLVRRNDALSVADSAALKPEAVVISPGPGRPADAGITCALIRELSAHLPILGVCLGHQAIGEVFGGEVVRAPQPVHGKVARIRHDGLGVFDGIPQDIAVARYHSLVIDRPTLPEALKITTESPDGLIMGVRHQSLPLEGVQFHPESVLTEHGHAMLRNFMKMARAWNARAPAPQA